MRNIIILALVCLIPMSLYEGREKGQIVPAIGFSILLAIGALMLAAKWM